MSSSRRNRIRRGAVNLAAFLGVGACIYLAAGALAVALGGTPPPTCLGSSTARRNIVYLHGLDSVGPSWQELTNRRTLASLPDVRVAIPRAPLCDGGRCWDPSRTDTTIAAIRSAAEVCFGRGAGTNVGPPFGVLGFSRGGFALAALASCADAGASWAIVAGAFGITAVDRIGLRDCPVAVAIGRRDRYHHAGAIEYASARAAAKLAGGLVEHDGGHRLDAASLARALDEVAAAPSRPSTGTSWLAVGDLAMLELVVLASLLVACSPLIPRLRRLLHAGDPPSERWAPRLVLVLAASVAAVLGVMPGLGLDLGPPALWPLGLAAIVAALGGRRALWVVCTSHGLAAAATLVIVRYVF
jgi:hypothetical protein